MCAVEPPILSYISKTLRNVYQWIYKLLYTNRAKLLVLLQDSQKQFKEEWKGVQQSPQQLSQYTVLAFSIFILGIFGSF